MNPKPKVVSLDLAKKMKELGYKQEGLWWWQVLPDNSVSLLTNEQAELNKVNVKYAKECYTNEYEKLYGYETEFYVTPTVAELREALPSGYYSIREGDIWECWLRNGKQKVEADTEANARGKMWIYLKEKGFL